MLNPSSQMTVESACLSTVTKVTLHIVEVTKSSSVKTISTNTFSLLRQAQSRSEYGPCDQVSPKSVNDGG